MSKKRTRVVDFTAAIGSIKCRLIRDEDVIRHVNLLLHRIAAAILQFRGSLFRHRGEQ